MSDRLAIRFGGIPDLDRTVALQSGEVAPSGIDFTYVGLEATAELESSFPDNLQAVETSLYDLACLVARRDESAIGIPIFTARYAPSQLLWKRPESNISGLNDLAGKRIAFHSADKTARIWADALLTNAYGVDPEGVQWVETASEQELASESVHADAFCLRPPVQDPRLIHIESPGELSSNHPRELGGVLPIFHVVAIRRDLYSQHRWIAVELMDAFIRAKSIGMDRLCYFGALAVGLPWLRRAVNDVNTNFDGDAYPYGLSVNRTCLEEFIATAARAGLIEDRIAPEDLFALETEDHPGVPNPTAYVVPLSRSRSWS